MNKTFKIEELYCAHCAAKMEEEINKIDGISNANLNFMTQKLSIITDDCVPYEKIHKKIMKAIKKIERNCILIEE